MSYSPLFSTKKIPGKSTIILVSLVAMLTTEPIGAEPSPGDQSQTGYVEGGIGFAKVSEDFFITVSIGTVLRVKKFGAAFQIPLRIRVVDREPSDEGVIREEDWDEVSDWFKIIRFLEYGSKSEPFYIRIGELVAATVGHGTLMSSYYNVMDIDHFQLGMELAVNTVYGGGELVLDNVAFPEVLGGRLYGRPAAFLDQNSFWNRLAVGVSMFMDINAPTWLLEDDLGNRMLDDTRTLKFDSESTVLLGFDIELEAVRNDTVVWMPYLDVNYHSDYDPGLHVGFLTHLFLGDVDLHSRLEYRLLGPHYLPAYFDSFYEIQRFDYLSRKPKLQWLGEDGNKDKNITHGGYGEITANILQRVFLTVAFEDYQGPYNTSAMIKLQVPAFEVLKFGAMYAKRNADGFSEIFDLHNAILLGEIKWQVYSFIHIQASFSRMWQIQDDGEYETINDFSVGAGVRFGF